GARIAAIVDVRRTISDEARRLASEARAELLLGHAVVGTEGRKSITGVRVQPFDAGLRTLSGTPRIIAADCLAVSGGWSPAIHLASQAGGKPRFDERLQAFLPPEPMQSWVAAGAGNGTYATAGAIS